MKYLFFNKGSRNRRLFHPGVSHQVSCNFTSRIRIGVQNHESLADGLSSVIAALFDAEVDHVINVYIVREVIRLLWGPVRMFPSLAVLANNLSFVNFIPKTGWFFALPFGSHIYIYIYIYRWAEKLISLSKFYLPSYSQVTSPSLNKSGSFCLTLT